MRRVVAAALCAAGMMAAGQAGATVVVENFTGSVFSGVDDLGLFGTAGADLTGLGYSATAIYDTDVGAYAGVINPGHVTSKGGAFFGTANPISNLSITIGGATWVVTGINFRDETNIDFFSRAGRPPFAQMSVSEDGGVGGGDVALFAGGTHVLSDDGTLTITAPAGNRSGGAILLPGMSGVITLSGNIATASPIGPPPVLPEPDAWALLILGFGGAGAALRRRRAALA